MLLEHPFDDLLLTAEGCRCHDPRKEREALDLAGELLVPTKAAINAAFAGKSDQQVAVHFAVSVQFARMRMAGPRKIVERSLQRRTAEAAGR